MKKETTEKKAYRISELMSAFGVGRTTIYDLIAKKHLETFKSGRITFISASSVNEWMKNCKAEADRQTQLTAAEKQNSA
ncbi:helix-turn-helix domain-containing protein [bacterium]|jgi:excisionase family DNA binding protein|nr:helix-turn-helix domain-containing protein [bacterium]